MSEVVHERETVQVWPDGSKIEVDRWRSDPIAPWSYGKYEAVCGTCGDQVAADPKASIVYIAYLSHAMMEVQTALMELSYRIGRARNGT